MTHILDRLAATIDARKGSDPGTSYTASVLARGTDGAAAKFREESAEFIAAVLNETPDRIAAEASDVIYHLLVAMAAADVPAANLWAELEAREGISGHAEKSSRGKKKKKG